MNSVWNEGEGDAKHFMKTFFFIHFRAAPTGQILALSNYEKTDFKYSKGPLYKQSKYAISFGLGLRIRAHRPLHFSLWPFVFWKWPLILVHFVYMAHFLIWPLPLQTQGIPCNNKSSIFCQVIFYWYTLNLSSAYQQYSMVQMEYF